MLAKLQGTGNEMGCCPRWRDRFPPTRREVVFDSEYGADGYGLDLDEMVLRDQTKEHAVRGPGTALRPEGNRAYVNVLYSLAGVNFALFLVGTIQVGRILSYQRSLTGSTEGALKEMVHDVEGQAKKLENKVEKEL